MRTQVERLPEHDRAVDPAGAILARGEADLRAMLNLGGYRALTAHTVRQSIGLLNAVVTLVSFIGVLWALSGPLSIPIHGFEIVIPGYMVWVALVAIGVSFVATIYPSWSASRILPAEALRYE